MKVNEKLLREAVLAFTKAHYKLSAIALSDSDKDRKDLMAAMVEKTAATVRLVRLGTELLQL